jgi:hypothetical protein
MFRGELISEKMKVNIPASYFSFWEFMNSQEDGIVFPLPVHRFAGWNLYEWGYQGAGFIWFPMKQAILDRDFDRWSVANEQAFRETQYAVYARDPDMLLDVLRKYNVSYLTWDTSIISFEEKNRNQILFKREIGELLDRLISSGQITKLQSFEDMHVYKVNEQRHIVTLKTIQTNVEPSYRWSHHDFAYTQHGDYTTGVDKTNPNTIYTYYPFRDFLTKTDRVMPEILNVDPVEKTYSLNSTVPEDYTNIHIPNYVDTESALVSYIYIEKQSDTNYNLLFDSILPNQLTQPLRYPFRIDEDQQSARFSFNGKSFFVDFTTLEESQPRFLGQGFIFIDLPNYLDGRAVVLEYQDTSTASVDAIENEIPLTRVFFDADDIADINNLASEGFIIHDKQNDNIRFSVINSQRGIHIPLDEVPQSLGYILGIKSRNITGLPIRFCIQNLYANTCSQYDELSQFNDFQYDYFLIPPTTNATGFGLSLDTISFGDYESVNELQEATLFPIQQNFFSSLYYYRNEPQGITPTYDSNSVRVNTSLPHKTVAAVPEPYETNSNTFVVFHQSYNDHWAAYGFESQPLFISYFLPMLGGTELPDHTLINNWANGWKINNAYQSYIFLFVPQYLQYAGYALLVLTLLAITPYHLIWQRSRSLFQKKASHPAHSHPHASHTTHHKTHAHQSPTSKHHHGHTTNHEKGDEPKIIK